MSNVFTQSNFSRSLAADAKASYYPTELGHCRMINQMLEFPEELCALEPSIGDGGAIKAVMGIEGAPPERWKLFGVEVDSERAKACQEDEAFECVLNADFLDGVKISHSAFCFCFANPPYGMWQTETKSVRYERAFMEKIWNHLKTGAIFVYVIPYSVFSDDAFIKLWVSRFRTVCVYKFHEQEFVKYKQIVVVGIRKSSLGFLKDELEKAMESVRTLDMVPLLPEHYQGEKIVVPSCSERSVQQFSSKVFDYDGAVKRLAQSPLYERTRKGIRQQNFAAYDLGRPPLPLKKDLSYLASVCGCGQGLAGSEEQRTLHLQRGSVSPLRASTIEESGDGKMTEVVRETAAIVMKIVENDGMIRTF